MIEPLPPEATDASDRTARPEADVVLGEQLSIYDIIDECANALGAWSPSENIDGGRRARRRARGPA